MKIDRNTKYKDFAPLEPYMSKGEADRIKAAAVRERFGADGFYTMTIGDMFAVLAGDIRPLLLKASPDTVFAVYLAKAFADFMDTLIANLKRLTLPPTAEQVKHSQGCIPSAFDESVYVFCRNYFGLQGFEAVERLKVADLLLAKKDAYNAAIVDRNIAAAVKKGGKP